MKTKPKNPFGELLALGLVAVVPAIVEYELERKHPELLKKIKKNLDGLERAMRARAKQEYEQEMQDNDPADWWKKGGGDDRSEGDLGRNRLN